MSIVPMADAVPGTIASSSEYNKLIDNIEDLNSRLHMMISSQVARDGLIKYPGLTIYRSDTKWIEVWDGSAWYVQGPIVVATTSDLTKVTSPYLGLLATVTATNLVYRHNGSAWKIAYPVGGGGAATRATAKYINTNSPATVIASGTDVTGTFPTASRTSNLVTASGTNNTTFTLNAPGWWDIKTSVRGSGGTTGMECRVCLSPQTTLSNTLAGGGAGGLSSAASVSRYFASGSQIQVGWFQNSGANKSPDASFGEMTSISFEFRGQED